jgi:hypothetical protein
MSRAAAILLATAAIAGCGSSSTTASACTGFPTGKHSTSFLVLFGAVSKLTRRDVCSRLGVPMSVNELAHEEEAWGYGSETLILRGERVVSVQVTKGAMGG